MSVTYEDAVKAQKELEDKLLEDPNVVSIGVVAEKNDLGEPTNEYIIKVGVISAEVYQNSISHGSSLIPNKYTPYQGRNLEKEVKCVRIQVVKTGEISALNANDRDSPSAIDDILVAEANIVNGHAARRRPSPGGYSIWHPAVTAGTLGLLLEYEEGPHMGKAFILSNNHVIAVNNLAYVGDAITQPGKHDSGNVGQDTIALLHRWVPLNYVGVNFVDAAIAEVCGGKNWASYVIPYVNHIGYPRALVDARIGMHVEKTGRTTGHTTGNIISINHTVKVNYHNIGKLVFKDQISTTNMSKGGDSGSCLFESGTRNPVGLLFAGDNSETFHNPIQSVISALSDKHENKYPSCKSQVFLPEHRLQVLQKRSFSTNAISPINSFFTQVQRVPVQKITKSGRYGLAVATVGIAMYTVKQNLAFLRAPLGGFFRETRENIGKEASLSDIAPKNYKY